MALKDKTPELSGYSNGIQKVLTLGTDQITNSSPSNPIDVYSTNIDSMLTISTGDVPGTTHINKFGHNPDVDVGSVPETLWDGGGQWIGPTADRIHSIVSTSDEDKGAIVSSGTSTETTTVTLVDSTATFISDGVAINDVVIDTTDGDHSFVISIDSETQLTIEELHHNGKILTGNSYIVVTPVGTGASVLHLKKSLGSDKKETTEYIVMNGTTPINTLQSYWRISRAHFDGCGSNGVNVGDVSLTAAIDSTVTAYIGAGDGQTLMAIYTVPKGKQAYMTGWFANITRDGSKSATADLELISVPYGMGNPYGSRVQGNIGLNNTSTSDIQRLFAPYRLFEAQTDIYINVANVSASDLKISGGFDLILVNDK